MNRAIYILSRFGTDLVSLLSRAANAVLFNGSTAQTLSSRAYIDGRDSRFWRGMGKLINTLFFWQDDHIKAAWEAEVNRARYTLQRLEGLR
ncbi:hypothetical protein [Roseovarius sp.]